MMYLSDKPSVRILVETWECASEPYVVAHIWFTAEDESPVRYYAEVWRLGELVETLTGPTHEAITTELESRHGPRRLTDHVHACRN